MEPAVPLKRRGRPRVASGQAATVCIRMSAEMYDALYAEAGRRGVTVPAVIRAAISVIQKRQTPPQAPH